MKLFFLLLVAMPLASFAQKPPADIRTAPAVLTITCEASKFEERKEAVLSGLETLGLSVKNTFYIPENPTLRAKDGEATKKLILEEQAKYVYLIQVIIVAEDYNYVLLIVDAENFDTPQTKVHYKTLGKTLEKLFKNYEKDLKKL